MYLPLANTSTRSYMEANGWTFENIGTEIESRFGNTEVECGKHSVYGWKTPGSREDASIAVFFGLLPGSATLDFGNCHAGGVVEVFVSDGSNRTGVKIATAHGHEKSKQVKIDFVRGTILNITTDVGIVKINSFDISCNGNLNIFLVVRGDLFRLICSNSQLVI